MIDTVRINNTYHSWGQTEVRADGELFNKYQSIDYDEKLEKTLIYGSAKHRKPIGKSKGKYIPGKLKFGCLVGSAAEFKKWMAGKASDGRSLALANIKSLTIQYTSADDIPVLVEFSNVGFVSATDAHKDDSGALTSNIELDFEYAVADIDGTLVTVWDSSEETL